MVKSSTVKDYSKKKTMDGSVCGTGEVLVPYRVDETMMKSESIIKENLETWKFCGKKVLIGFLPIQEANAEMMMKLFWKDVNDYLEKFRKKPCYLPNGKGAYTLCKRKNCNSCEHYGNFDSKLFTSLYSSLEEILEGLEDEDKNAVDPTGTTKQEDERDTLELLNCLLDDLRVLDEKYPEVFRLHYEGCKKGEILKQVNLELAKSQGYAFIDKVLKAVQKIYTEKYLK